MFCAQCGGTLSENSNFCPNCGVSIAAQAPGLASSAPSTSDTKQDKLPNHVVGHLYYELIQLSQTLSHQFVDSMSPTYKTLDGFIFKAESDVAQIFSQINCYFEKFLKGNNVYQYQEEQIRSYTQRYTGNWIEVFNAALQAYQNITGEEQQMRHYREVRKVGRGKVIGGGFSLSGAAKGMLTAGALNMTTGMVHSLANAWGNARSAAEADRKKTDFFRNGDFRDEVEIAICTDCYNMLEGFAALWNQLNLGYLVYYSDAAREQAINIAEAIFDEQVPENQYDSVLLKRSFGRMCG